MKKTAILLSVVILCTIMAACSAGVEESGMAPVTQPAAVQDTEATASPSESSNSGGKAELIKVSDDIEILTGKDSLAEGAEVVVTEIPYDDVSEFMPSGYDPVSKVVKVTVKPSGSWVGPIILRMNHSAKDSAATVLKIYKDDELYDSYSNYDISYDSIDINLDKWGIFCVFVKEATGSGNGSGNGDENDSPQTTPVPGDSGAGTESPWDYKGKIYVYDGFYAGEWNPIAWDYKRKVEVKYNDWGVTSSFDFSKEGYLIIKETGQGGFIEVNLESMTSNYRELEYKGNSVRTSSIYFSPEGDLAALSATYNKGENTESTSGMMYMTPAGEPKPGGERGLATFCWGGTPDGVYGFDNNVPNILFHVLQGGIVNEVMDLTSVIGASSPADFINDGLDTVLFIRTHGEVTDEWPYAMLEPTSGKTTLFASIEDISSAYVDQLGYGEKLSAVLKKRNTVDIIETDDPNYFIGIDEYCTAYMYDRRYPEDYQYLGTYLTITYIP